VNLAGTKTDRVSDTNHGLPLQSRYQLERSNLGKVNLQLVANEEEQDRTQRGENDASRMKSGIGRPRKHVGDRAADDRPDDTENDRPENRHVNVHDRFRDDPGDEPNKNVPD
jgi:hypothetical protein